MTIRLHREGIGTFEADTAQEMVALVAAMEAHLGHVPEVGELDEGSPDSAVEEARTAVSDASRWTGRLVRQFVESLDHTPRDTIAACLNLGTGASSQALAEMLGKSTRGLGSRMHHIAKVTREFREGLPPPVRLVGDHGDKRIEIDQDFLTVYKEEI